MKYPYIILFMILGFTSCNSDVEEVKLEGYVFADGKPVKGQKLYVNNYFYEGGDYDSFMPVEKHSVVTDDKGYYTILLARSAYVQIDTVDDGYTDAFTEKYVYKNNVRLDVTLSPH